MAHQLPIEPTLDLHAFAPHDVVSVVEEYVTTAAAAGFPVVRIIHGRSGGRVKSAVHTRLRQLGAARNVRLDPGNPGVTIVTF